MPYFDGLSQVRLGTLCYDGLEQVLFHTLTWALPDIPILTKDTSEIAHTEKNRSRPTPALQRSYFSAKLIIFSRTIHF